MTDVISVILFGILVALVALRVLVLRLRGIRAFVFGRDRGDFVLVPGILLLLYGAFGGVFHGLGPSFLLDSFGDLPGVDWLGISLSFGGLLWLVGTLVAFGSSFRMGIDERTSEVLVTTGPFAWSRNPIYVGFLVFALGVFLVHFNGASLLGVLLFLGTIHRQVLGEEKFLLEHYGQGYVEYCERVRRYL